MSRQEIAALLYKVLLPLMVACLIVAKIPLLPRKLKLAAAWGLSIGLVLIMVRLALLAFGD